MELTVSQHVYFSNKEPVPLCQIAESLLALEQVVKRSEPAFKEIFDGVIIDDIQVYVKSITTGSLYEDLFVKFVFGSQEKMDLVIGKVRSAIGMDKLNNNPKLLGILITAIITGAIVYLAMDDEKPTPAIEVSHNTIINIGATELEMDADDLRLIIKAVVEKDQDIAKNAVKVVQPAKADPNAQIEFNELEETTLSSQVVHEFPESIPDVAQEKIEDFPNLGIRIRATDLDSHKRGWAAVAESISDERVKLQFDPHINPELLSSGQLIYVDASVMFEVNGQDKKPKLIFVRDVHSDSNAP